jgi:hypothetical protein
MEERPPGPLQYRTGMKMGKLVVALMTNLEQATEIPRYARIVPRLGSCGICTVLTINETYESVA